MPTLEINLGVVCARCKKELEGAQIYGALVKVKPCPCLVNDYKKGAQQGVNYLSDKDLKCGCGILDGCPHKALRP
jgi:hypothetical protein